MDKQNLKKEDVVWLTLDNENATSTLFQHGFFNAGCGNLSLCGRFRGVDGDYSPASVSQFIPQGMSQGACKTCKRVFGLLDSRLAAPLITHN